MKHILLLAILALSSVSLAQRKGRMKRHAPPQPANFEYKAVCEVNKANTTDPNGSWVSIAKKEIAIKPLPVGGGDKLNSDITITVDDLQIDYTALFTIMMSKKDSTMFNAYAVMEIKNLKTKDVLMTSNDGQPDISNQTTAAAMGRTEINYTLGGVDPKLPNSYLIGCYINVVGK